MRFTFDGKEVVGYNGDSVAAALLGADITTLGKRIATEQYRAPYCMMGTCFDCVVSIDGVSVQACQIEIKQGLSVSSLHTHNASQDDQD